ncbi:MAG: HEAT repeat domain-containing protein [Pegethrix bostrychoides GSE-TBD4-15B]|jgi:HEAT repeat protein|uniref:HEAT repeat domain-containing protein n=1 Tax=Pegethrix bostrychoides GSE-TBD4-15B TaxID=2839662 RepID=A0A951P906_9CYAN|nr:HEAT repeat domain-containing protein [Pegethrix bostrychoides GSE-TBD4-15B]
MSESVFDPQLESQPVIATLERDAVPEASSNTELAAAIIDLQFGDFHRRWDAAKRLPGLGDRAIAPLLSLIPTADQVTVDDWELLWFVARILGNFQHPTAVSALVNLLETAPDPEITTMAAMALTNFGEAALPALTDLLRQPATRLMALQALAQIQHPAVLPLLLKAATDSLAAVRVAAVVALSQLQAAEAAVFWAAFTARLSDAAAEVRRAAVMALGVRSELLTAELGVEALVAALRPLLEDEALEVRRQAVLSLGRVSSEAAVAVLGQALHDPDSLELQVELLHALAWTERPTALAQIQRYLERHLACQAAQPTALDQEIVAVLGRITDQAALATQMLLGLLAAAHPIAQTVTGKQQIALSLGQLQQAEAIDPLIDLLADSAVTVRLHAAAALKQLAAQGAATQMQRRLSDPTSSAQLRATLVMALQEPQLARVS